MNTLVKKGCLINPFQVGVKIKQYNERFSINHTKTVKVSPVRCARAVNAAWRMWR